MRQKTGAHIKGRIGRLLLNSLLILTVATVATGFSFEARADASATPSLKSSNSVAPMLSTARSNPTRIRIPSIGVNSAVMKLGLLRDGSLQVPPAAFPAGWYTGSPTPGEIGPAIIAGHIDWNGPGVFYRLDRINLGDEILVDRANGTRATFSVIRVASFLKNNFPTHAVYGNVNYPGLRLITCGDYDFRIHKYVRDLVVFAKLTRISKLPIYR